MTKRTFRQHWRLLQRKPEVARHWYLAPLCSWQMSLITLNVVVIGRKMNFWRISKDGGFRLDLDIFRIRAPCLNMGTVDRHAPWAVSDVRKRSR